MSTRRALHFVFKVGDRTKTAKFYKDVLGMKILRHEEFDEGCKAACNGPYAGKWSKTMVGYGPEDSHFVVELTYNYGLSEYQLGNDFLGITVKSSRAFSNAKKIEPSFKDGNDGFSSVQAPGGYAFHLIDEQPSEHEDPVVKVTLASSNLKRSIDYWTKLVGMELFASEVESCALLGFADNQCKLELHEIGKDVDHGTAFGRIALSCPTSELADIEQAVKDAGEKILTPLVSLDTPGKATVSVVILADPDGHEICFVGDEGFRELSRVDPNSDQLLTDAMEADLSDQWFAKKGLTKAKA